MRKTLNGLALLVDDFIYHNRHNKADIASQLGMSRQGLYNLIHKDNFTIDDANKILDVVGYKLDYNIVPK